MINIDAIVDCVANPAKIVQPAVQKFSVRSINLFVVIMSLLNPIARPPNTNAAVDRVANLEMIASMVVLTFCAPDTNPYAAKMIRISQCARLINTNAVVESVASLEENAQKAVLAFCASDTSLYAAIQTLFANHTKLYVNVERVAKVITTMINRVKMAVQTLHVSGVNRFVAIRKIERGKDFVK